MSDHQGGVGPQPPSHSLNVGPGQTVRLQQVLTTGTPQNLNVLSSRGQQFVITSQVPGLTQVIPTIATSNATIQQGGTTRIINIAPSRRVSVLGVPQVSGHTGNLQLTANNGNGSELSGRGTVSLVAIGQPTVATVSSSHPTLVSSLSSPPRQRATSAGRPGIQQAAVPRKRARLSDLQERPPPNEEVAAMRQSVQEQKTIRMRELCEQYAEHAAEAFFLQAGGNMMDYHIWRKKPSTPQFLHFLRTHRLDPDDDDEDLTQQLSAAVANASQNTDLKVPSSVSSSPSPAQVNVPFATNDTTTVTAGTNSVSSSLHLSSQTTAEKSLPVSPVVKHKTSAVNMAPRFHARQHSISALYDNSIGSQEQIAEKAKQEAYVMQRILELQKEGLWSEKRLPKVQEPPRAKAHWDYLIEEMVWLAADFAQERKWKKAAAKKCARNVQKYFQEKEAQAQKAEKIQELRLKKIAGFMAKEVKTFWANVEKLVEYKQQTRLEEKRKKALDQHLSFIVDQTEKYSNWLAESMNKGGDSTNVSVPASVASSRLSSPSRKTVMSDDEFQPNQSSTDDEETIAKAEEDTESQNHSEEIELLKRESEIPLEDLLKELPEDYLQSRDTNSNEESKKDETDSEKGEDDEFIVESDKESMDDEETIQEQEAAEGNVDHKKELAELQAESEMSIEDLMAKYKGSFSADDTTETEVHEVSEVDTEEDEDDDDDDDNDDDNGEESQSEDEAEGSSSEEETDIGLKTLLSEETEMKDEKVVDNETAGKEINDVAALAESIQPKGNTLSSTSVVTPIPFLLKHSLREYQHIGLDWLVTMFDRKLNGILADEMGLGKTIQTISLLAHLACEKGNWGPHLIIVPTSVMLNWEMEFKKWCPAFKILTYYGSQKERKQKRTGWTKPNAFHVCITSYKLVIQDHQSFRRKKWKYLILDEAQNIKNFKSQRWQLLLNFQTQRRLLLTGTPLQNNLMELWSLMHFLMPNVFQSHREFKEWFSNPVTGMIEGNSEYNESIIKRLHKVLRPFLLRRLKIEVEKQLPKKYEHVVMCRLSKRQRFLYDDFMSRAKTRETLASGNLLSVINVLMQLRKVCNHPNLFEARPTISPFQMEGLTYTTASLVYSALDYDPFKHVDLFYLNLLLLDLEFCLTAFVAHRIKKYQAPRKLIEEIDTKPDPAPRCPAGKIKIHVRMSTSQQQQPPSALFSKAISNIPVARVGTSPSIVAVSPQVSGQGITLRVPSTGTSSQAYAIQLVNQEGTVKAVPVSAAQNQQQQQHQVVLQPNSIQVQQSKPVDGVQKIPVSAGFAHIVQSSGGRHILLTSSAQIVQPLPSSQTVQAGSTGVLPNGQRVTVLSKSATSSSVTSSAVNRIVTSSTSSRPVMRVPPLNVNTVVHSNHSSANSVVITGTTTLTTTTTTTSTKTSAVLTQPVLAALVQQTRNNVSSKSIITLSGGSLDLDGIKSLASTNHKQETSTSKDSVFYLPELNKKRQMKRREKLCMINMVNQRRCAACPIYGSDLVEAVRIVDQQCTSRGWKSSGYVHCQHAHRQCNRPEVYWNTTEALKAVIHTNTSYVEELKDTFSRFLLFVPAVAAPLPKFHVSHPPPSRLWEERRFTAELQQELSPHCALLYPVVSAMATQFPDPRLIQYDCGKLQVLDKLLRHLKTEHHRVLIFTQMTKMLDVLEAFLNYHGHIYLRLDGTTRVDQRQLLMERFNADRRIFCFILSTRSGGIGVNLTGADTVIFYDSDWNPTMDAQAQDRCHRIGQTRDVHIYRLVSEMTVEENILKKANQKRLLGDLAIEGGNFTTAYFKKSTIQDLFNIDINEDDPSRRMAEILEKDNEKEKKTKDESQAPAEEKAALGALESALAAAEDESDVIAARTATAEAAADLAEFDESIPLEEAEGNTASGEQEISKAEQEVRQLEQQLTPVERYAMRFVEETEAAWSAEQLAAAEAEIEQQKREWELGRLQALKEEEERCTRLSEDEEEQPLTFSRVAAHNQVLGSTQLKEQLMMWCPPTPPQDDNDVYIDHSLGFLYEQTIMSESQLPAVYVKKDFKRYRLDVSPGSDRDARRPHKMRHREDSVYAPRSLFDRPSPALLKMRRDMKLQKYRGGTVRPMLSISSLKPTTTVKQITEPEHVPEWHIHEEWALLQAVQSFLQLPLNLMVLSPAHTPNWDMVSDIVNNVSCTYRSPKQCRNRYETVIVPREEGKVFYDTNPKKQKKTKGVYKLPPQTKAGRPLRTSQLFLQDNNSSFTSIYLQRFEVIKEMSSKRKPLQKPQINPALKNQRAPPIFLENGVDYDDPISPQDAAARRLERIARDKTKTLDQQEEQRRQQQQRAQQAGQLSQQQQQQQVQQLRQQQQPGSVVAGTSAMPPATAAGSLPTVVAAAGSTVSGISSSAVAPVIATSSSPSVSSSLPMVVTTVTAVTAATVVSSVVNAIRNARTVTASVSQDGASGQVRTVTSSTPIVSVAGLTPAQVQAATQRLVAQSSSAATSSAAAVVAKGVPTMTGSGTKTITQAQLQLYRQQALLRQQQRIATQQLKVLQAQAGQKVSVAMTAGGVTTVQVSQAQQQRAQQLIKHHAAATAAAASGKQTVTRAVPDSEMAAMFKRQQQLIVQQQKAQQVQVSTQGSLSPAHFLAQVQQAGTSGQTQVATLVKAVSAASGSQQSVTIPVAGVTIPQVKAALTPGTMKAATPQQMRQLALQQQQLLQQRKIAGQKVAQLTQVANKAGVPTQLIVQSQKALPSAMTVQHIQQVIKQVQPQAVQQFTHVSGAQTLATQVSGSQVYSLAKGTQVSGATLHTRMLPVAGNQQTLKQIQVVAAPNVRSSVPNVTIDSCGRPQVSVASTLSSALANTIKVAQSGSTVQQQAILSQVSAALQGQTVPVTVRQTSQSPVRIQAASSGTAPLVAVAVQPASQVTHTQSAPGSSNDLAQ